MRNLQDLHLTILVTFWIRVHANNHAVARLHFLTKAITGFRNLPAEIALMNAGHHAAHVINFLNEFIGVGFHAISERLHEPASTKRIHRAMHASFMRQNLLRSKRHANRGLRWQAKSFIHAVGMQTLATSQHASERLISHAHNVVHGLLLGQRTTRCLNMRAHKPTSFLLGAKSEAHGVGPNTPRGTQFANLLKELIMAIEEET